ncbi:hypothetical protein [Actinoplanes cyaneus]|uniref:hypothetical protein n=1 Tax=Actinoplanes cyaneus TaxID=52696 RepID=UPI0019453711|nr:hypothetical protein [Actinoplanes cyaneus]
MQRLTQARACGQIAVLADGRVAEVGSHDELLARGGTYAGPWALWDRQSVPRTRAGS